MCCLVAPSLPEIEAEHGRLGKTGPGLWALWNIGKAEAIWKSPGAEEIPNSLGSPGATNQVDSPLDLTA